MSLLSDRLRNHQLTGSDRKHPADVVSWFGAMQAQDYPAAKWAVGLRAPGCRDADVEQAFTEGAILRTHVLRPTWHFVTPADLRWMVALSAPRIHAANAYYYRQAGLEARTFARSCAMIHRALEGGRALTRAELAVYLKRARVAADGLKLAYLMMHAELEAVICSGPRRGTQFTYALVDERAPRAKPLARQDAITELARRYFASHGPATLRDFAWWSGLTMKDARLGMEAVTPSVRAVAASRACTAFLMPNHDEYLLAYKDRRGIVDTARAANVVARSNGAFPHHLIIDGRLAGSWARTLKGHAVRLDVAPYRKLSPAETRAVTAAADSYGEFLSLPASLSIV